jgi:hypothetical protein
MQQRKDEVKGLFTELLGTVAYLVFIFAITAVLAR